MRVKVGDSEGGGKGEGELMQQTIQIGAASHANEDEKTRRTLFCAS